VRLLLLTAILVSTIYSPVLAQQSPERDYTIVVTPAELNTIALALEQLPYRQVYALYGKLVEQKQKQDSMTTKPRAKTKSVESPNGR